MAQKVTKAPQSSLYHSWKGMLLFSILLFLTVVCLTFILPMRGEGRYALVEVKGKKILQIDLDRAEDQILHINGELPVTLEVKNGKIRFIDAVCPDKICQNTGFIGTPAESAVCLPAKTSVVILGQKLPDSQLSAVGGSSEESD